MRLQRDSGEDQTEFRIHIRWPSGSVFGAQIGIQVYVKQCMYFNLLLLALIKVRHCSFQFPIYHFFVNNLSVVIVKLLNISGRVPVNKKAGFGSVFRFKAGSGSGDLYKTNTEPEKLT